MQQFANRNATGLARRDREWPLNDGQIPNPNVARVAPGTGYHRVEGNRRASRNGPRERPPTRNPFLKVTIRNVFVAVSPCTTMQCSTSKPAARTYGSSRCGRHPPTAWGDSAYTCEPPQRVRVKKKNGAISQTDSW
jgi:hypothetical protein